MSVPVDNSGARGFDYTFEVANKFDYIVINNNLYNIPVDLLCSTYQNHVLHDGTYREFWTNAMKDTPDIKSDKGMYKPDAFQKICNTVFNFWSSNEHHVAAGDCLLHYMRNGKKRSERMTPQAFLTCFQKALRVENDTAKVLLFHSFPEEHINDTFIMVAVTLIPRPWKTSRIYSKAIIMPLHPNNLIIILTKAKPPITTMPFSPLVIKNLIQLLIPTILPVAPMTGPIIAITPKRLMVPAHHMFATNEVSAKILAQLNGPSAKCTTLPLGHWHPNGQRL